MMSASLYCLALADGSVTTQTIGVIIGFVAMCPVMYGLFVSVKKGHASVWSHRIMGTVYLVFGLVAVIKAILQGIHGLPGNILFLAIGSFFMALGITHYRAMRSRA